MVYSVLNKRFWVAIFTIVFTSNVLFAQSLQRPIIYITSAERQAVLDKISTNDWAEGLVESMKNNVDPQLATHQSDPNAIFSSLPDIPEKDNLPVTLASPYAAAHGKVLSTAEYSAVLYFITEEEKYASFAGDIIAYYFDELSTRTLETTTICGDHFFDPRRTFNHIAVVYDFTCNYLNTSGTTVYNKASGTRVAYDNAKAQKVIKNIAGNTLYEAGGYDRHGQVVSNHPILTAPGSLFSLLCVDDDAERERMFNLFWERGTRRQNSFKHTVLNMFGEQGIWPESVSYGFMPNVQLILNMVDRIKPELNAGPENLRLFEGSILLENLRLPNRYFVRYGDSHRFADGTNEANLYALNFAKRRGFTQLQHKAEIAILQFYAADGGYKPSVSATKWENYSALELFWGEKLPDNSVEKFDYKPTVIIKHAGVALQRNYVDVDNEDYGLCGIIGGAHYVHAHCTGITMELYGGGDVMAPNGGLPAGLPARGESPFVDYFNRYAGNNTVIVNGTSHGIQHPQGWGANRYLYQDTTKNIDAEPKHLENPISRNFSFATQFLDDNVNNCDQQRTLSTIRTSSTTAYYVDIFRSKSNGTNNFHDYVYHNIGDKTSLTNTNDEELSVSPTTRYQTDFGDVYKSPGWRLFEDTKATEGTSEAVKIRFDLEVTKRYMHMFVPGGVEREYTKALGPATYEALNGYVDKKTQIIAIRQQGEAWDRPYIGVFEPTLTTTSSVRSVENIELSGKIVGAIVTSLVDGKEIKDYIISLDKEGSVNLPEHFISFKGRFGIVRKEAQSENTETVTLYIGSGEKLNYANLELLGDADNKNVNTVYGVQKLTPDTRFTITTQVFGGGGTISLQPNQTDYAAGSQVVVMANPEFGNVVDSWLGNAEGSASTDTITMFSDKNVFVRFRVGDFYTLNTTAEHGSVTQSEEGTDFIEQSCIDLTAVPDEGYQFDGWSGSLTSDENPLTVCFDANKNITANFKVATSIDKVFSESIVVSPNPSQGLFRVQVPLASLWSVYDISGKLIESGKADGDFELDLTASKKSFYIVKISTAKGIAVKRLLIN